MPISRPISLIALNDFGLAASCM